MKKTLVVITATATLVMGAVLSASTPVRAEESVDAALTASIAKLNPEQKAALLVLVRSIVDAQSTETPEEGAMKTVAIYIEAAESANIDELMEQVSEDFSHYEVGDKSGYRAFLEQIKADGMMEGISGYAEDAKAEVDGDTVKVHPVELEGIFGTATFEFELKKDGEQWKIIGLDMTGV